MKAASNIWKLYLFRFFKDFWLIMPIIVPFYKSHGMSNTEILMVQGIFSASQLIFEIPSGYFSDAIGRRFTLIIGAAALPAGLLVYLTGNGFAQFAVAEAILGFGFAMCSGTESAMIHDTLSAGGRECDYHRIEGNTESLSRTGTAIASVCGGFLALMSLDAPFMVNAVTGFFMFIIALTLIEPSRKKRDGGNPFTDMLKIVRYSIGHREILPVMLMSSAVLITGIIAIWGYLMFSEKYGLPTSLNGIGFAVFQLASAAGAASSSRISGIMGRGRSYALLAAIPVILILTAAVSSPLILAIAPVHAFIWGFSFPFFMNELNRLISPDMRATVLSTGGMIGRLLFVAAAPLFGAVADSYSLGYAFLMLVVIYILLFLAGKISGKRTVR